MGVQCPRCNVECEIKEVKRFLFDIVIDICPKCNGMWLDKGEFKKLTKNRDIEKFLTKFEGFESVSDIRCPRCNGIMDLERVIDVEVDVCVDCKGIWLDKGEYKELTVGQRKDLDKYLKSDKIPDYPDKPVGRDTNIAVKKRARITLMALKYTPTHWLR
jgi:Zn-finger nucleic acid-binding protein